MRGPHHGDHHDLWIDPVNPLRMIDSNDGGVDISADGGKSWFAPPLPISQFYHVAADTRTPYRVMGCMQDLGSASGPSRAMPPRGRRQPAARPGRLVSPRQRTERRGEARIP